jgi:hypothetical protein
MNWIHLVGCSTISKLPVMFPNGVRRMRRGKKLYGITILLEGKVGHTDIDL